MINKALRNDERYIRSITNTTLYIKNRGDKQQYINIGLAKQNKQDL